MKCPICASENTKDLKLVRVCVNCDHAFQDPPIVSAHYDWNYISTYDRYPATRAMSYLRAGLVAAHAKGKLLDVGYGNGAFLSAAKHLEFDVHGSDLHGVKSWVPDVPLVSDEQWDVVTFFDSLEHFPSLEPAQHVLKRTQTAVVSVPLRPVWWPALLPEWKHYKPGEHMHYFSQTSLREFMADLGLHSVPYAGDIEDAIRGPLSTGDQNILTAVFKR